MSIGKPVDDWRVIVDDPAIDLIDIATPNNLHFPIAMAAMERGKASRSRETAGADARGGRCNGGDGESHWRADFRCV